MSSRMKYVALVTGVLATAAAAADPERRGPGAVFTMTDDARGNAVLAYARASDGTLEPAGVVSTGGEGSGGGEAVLGSQASIALTSDGRFLLVVNAGSDDVSSFHVDGAQLTLVDRAPSGGVLPVSVTEHDGLVYVLNAGGAGSISGLVLGEHGNLTPLSGSTRPLGTPGGGGAQVAFDRSGEVLAVTEKSAREISLYSVDREGRASNPIPFPSSGATPFGFAFTSRDVLVVSEAGGGPSGTSAVSSYGLDDASLRLVSPSVPDHQLAACWLVLTTSGRNAFVANAGSGDISAYQLDPDGSLSLPAAGETAGTLPGGKPLDLALSRGDRFLYAVDARNHAIAIFAVSNEGGLTPIGTAANGLPASAVGLAAN